MNNREIAERIATNLFTSGSPRHGEVDRLVMTTDDGRDLGGWCKDAVIDQIVKVLDEPPKPKKPKARA